MEYKLITTFQELETYYTKLQNADILAIDTEFIRRDTYFPKLSLLQICYKLNEAIIIDCLAADINLSEILRIIYKPNIIKVFHSCRQDLEILYQLTGEIPPNLFDTQIALLALNYTKDISYEKMIQQLLKISLDKSLTHSNWEARPLSPTQIEYAAYDCLYLYEAYLKIRQLLEQQDRNHWLNEEFKSLENPHKYLFHPQKIAHKIVSGKNDITYNMALEIVIWREEQAKNLNLPRNNIIKDEVIKNYLKNKNKNFATLQKHINSSVHNTDIEGLKNTLDHINNVLPLEIKAKNILNTNQQDLLQILQIALRLRSIKFAVNPYLVAYGEDLINYCLNKEVSFMAGWKYEVFGHVAEKIINGQIGLAIKNSRATLIDL